MRSDRAKSVLPYPCRLRLAAARMRSRAVPGKAVANALADSNHQRQAEPGLTLIEGLVAIVVIAVTVAAITPPIFVATATRIQTRRAEQARGIAQGEVDRVRALMERGVSSTDLLPGVTGAGVANARAVAAPSTTVNTALPMLTLGATGGNCGSTLVRYPATTPVAFDQLIRVDIDGDCTPEYTMQVFRLPSDTPPGASAPFSFTMGVRVYAYVPGQIYTSLSVEPSSLALTTGRRDRAGATSGQRPLAVLTSLVSRNDSSRSLGQICRQSGGTTAECQLRD
jgi:type II secretory pathway pseudopilin PulG